ncbi:MAG: DUF424 family protein [Zestosphaera sp.]
MGLLDEILVYVRIHKTEGISQDFKEVVTVCDKELLGKTLKEGDVSLVVNEEFFGGFLATIDEAMHYVRNAQVAVLVGTVSVSRAINEGLVHPDAVLRINETPYAQVMKL